MKVEHIKETNSDLMIVNAARCSFSKESKLTDGKLSQADTKLISFLVREGHWSPLAHPVEVFKLTDADDSALLRLLTTAKHKEGFRVVKIGAETYVRGSLWSWLNNINNTDFLDDLYRAEIKNQLQLKYPETAKIICGTEDNLHFLEYTNASLITDKINNDEVLARLATNQEELELLSSLGSVTFRIKSPVFVARQLQKHTVGLVWNEVSRRYVDYMAKMFKPGSWRLRAVDKKQGSLDISLRGLKNFIANLSYGLLCGASLSVYFILIKLLKVSPEQARMVLLQSMLTEWYWTGSLNDFKRVCHLRLDTTAQKETQVIAQGISEELHKLYPKVWPSLLKLT